MILCTVHRSLMILKSPSASSKGLPAATLKKNAQLPAQLTEVTQRVMTPELLCIVTCTDPYRSVSSAVNHRVSKHVLIVRIGPGLAMLHEEMHPSLITCWKTGF